MNFEGDGKKQYVTVIGYGAVNLLNNICKLTCYWSNSMYKNQYNAVLKTPSHTAVPHLAQCHLNCWEGSTFPASFLFIVAWYEVL